MQSNELHAYWRECPGKDYFSHRELRAFMAKRWSFSSPMKVHDLNVYTNASKAVLQLWVLNALASYTIILMF
jgi:hypothetical protein